MCHCIDCLLCPTSVWVDFLYSFIQIFLEYLLYTRHWTKKWGNRSDQNLDPDLNKENQKQKTSDIQHHSNTKNYKDLKEHAG